MSKSSDYLKAAAGLIIAYIVVQGFLNTRPHRASLKLAGSNISQEEAMGDVFPSASSFEPVMEGRRVLYYKAFGKDGNHLGYVFRAHEKGYTSVIVSLTGMDLNGRIVGIKIMEENETPEYWAKFVRPRLWFEDKFKGKDVARLDSTVDFIASATITAQAVIDSVQAKGLEILERTRYER